MFRSLATSATALIVAAAPALADVTPAEVWENLSSYYTNLGYQVTEGGRDDVGQTLTLTDVVISSEGETSATTVTVPKITLQETGDAKVRTVFDGDITADFVSQAPEQEDMTAHVTVSMPGNEMISSGSAADMEHQIAYPQMDVATRLASPGEPTDEIPINVKVADLAGTYRITSGDEAGNTYDLTIGGVDLNVDAQDLPAGDDSGETGSMAATVTVADLAMTGSMASPKGALSLSDAPHQAFEAGMVIQSQLSTGAMNGEMQFSGTDAEGMKSEGTATFSNASSEFSVSLSKDGMSYQGSAKDSKAELQMANVPFPIAYAAESATGALSLPISQSEEAQPFKFTYALAGLTLAEGIWDLFDPGKKLPRDPASLTIDLDGQAVVTADLLDPATAEGFAAASEAAQAEGDPDAMPPAPLKVESVKINQIALNAVGASADVKGDLTLPEGTNQPVGTVEGSFTGINALLDNLVAMGIVPQEQMMGARMMLAMFARPAEGNPDQLQTKLEFKEDGSIFANGQQVK